ALRSNDPEGACRDKKRGSLREPTAPGTPDLIANLMANLMANRIADDGGGGDRCREARSVPGAQCSGQPARQSRREEEAQPRPRTPAPEGPEHGAPIHPRMPRMRSASLPLL